MQGLGEKAREASCLQGFFFPVLRPQPTPPTPTPVLNSALKSLPEAGSISERKMLAQPRAVTQGTAMRPQEPFLVPYTSILSFPTPVW